MKKILSFLVFFLFIPSIFFAQSVEKGVNLPDVQTVEKLKAEYNSKWDRLSDSDKKKRNEAVLKIEEAKKLYESDDIAGAAALCDKALKIWEDILETFVFCGAVYEKTERYYDAIKLLERYIREYDGRDKKAYRLLGACFRKTKRPAQAVNMYLSAYYLDKTDNNILLELALARIEAGDLNIAEENLKSLLKSMPKEPAVYIGLADLYIRKKDLNSAFKILKKGEIETSQNPQIISLLNSVSVIIALNESKEFFIKKDYTKALNALLEVESVALNDTRILMEKAKIYLAMNDKKSAFESFKKAVEIDPSLGEAWYFLGIINQETLEVEVALENFLKAELTGFLNPDLFLRISLILLDKEYYDRALYYAEKGLALDPSMLSLKLVKGIALYGKTEYEKAFEIFQAIIEIDKNNSQAKEYLDKTKMMLLVKEGNEAFDNKDFEVAVKKYEAALKIIPNSDDIAINLALAYNEVNKTNESLKILRGLYQKTPDSTAVLEALASVFEKNNRPDESSFYLKRLEELQKVNALSWINMGKRSENNNRFDEAEQFYRKALQIEPTSKEAKRRIAITLFKKAAQIAKTGDFDLCLSILEKAKIEDPSNIDIIRYIDKIKALRLIKEAQIEYKKGSFAKSVSIYSQALKIDYTIPEIFYGLGQVYFSIGDLNKSADSLEKCISVDQNYLDAYKLLSDVFRRLGRLPDAIQIISKALSLNKDDAELHLKLGYLFYLNNDAFNAKIAYRSALSLNPKDPEVHINLGLVYFQEGDYSMAEQEFLIASRLSPGLDDVWYNLGLIYYKQNRYPEAVEAFKESISINPDVSEKYFALARTFYYMPEWIDEAVVNCEKAFQMNPLTRYRYGLGKIYEKKLENSKKSDEEIKYRSLAIQSYESVIKEAPGTQLAIWSEERLKVLMQAVKLVKIYRCNSSCINVVKRGTIIASSLNGTIYGFSKDAENEDGLVWTLKIPGSNPVLNFKNDTVYTVSDDTLFALSETNGSIKWSVRIKEKITTIPFITDKGIFIGTEYGRIIGVDLNGTLFFESQPSGAILKSIIVENNNIFLSDIDGKIFCIEPLSGKVLWSFTASDRLVSSLAISADKVFASSVDGSFYFIDKFKGTLLKRIIFNKELKVTPVVAKNGIIIASDNVISMLSFEGEVLWSLKLSESITDISSVNGKDNLFVSGENGGISCVNLTGRLIWTYRLGSSSLNSFLIGDTEGLFATSSGEVYHLEFIQQ